MKKAICITLCLLLTAALAGCGAQEQETRRQRIFLDLFDTVTVVAGYAESDEVFEQAAQTLYDCLLRYHRLFDIYNEYDGMNNLKTINDNAGVAPVPVDPEIIEMLLLARAAYTQTGGAVNVAMGSVLAVWHEYRTAGLADPAHAALPPAQTLRQAAEHCDIEQLVIDEQAGTVYLADPEMRLDVGAIAKGYAAGKAAGAAARAGIDRCLLSVGGNVCTVGDSPEERPWSVGIENPENPQNALCALSLDAGCVVVSGNYQRYYTVGGVNYHHIIDPETLMPAAHFEEVAVVCADSGLADALSTALFVLPYEQGAALVESMDGVEAMWVIDLQTVRYSSGFAAMLTP